MNDIIVNCQLSRTGTYRSASIIATNKNVTSICTSADHFFGSFLQVYPSTIGTIHNKIESYLLVRETIHTISYQNVLFEYHFLDAVVVIIKQTF